MLIKYINTNMNPSIFGYYPRFYRTSVKSNLELNTELEEIIVGSLLGDLTAERKNVNCNTRLHFKQSTKNEIYLNHLYSLFKIYCGSEPKIMTKFDNRPTKMKEYKAIKFQTLSLPCFNKYKELFYNSKGIKIIPYNLEEILTAKGLAAPPLLDNGRWI
jgi:LAGLIDADG DNA endonuclease family